MEENLSVTSGPSDHKARPLWRWVAALTAIAIGTYEIVGYKVARSINLNYFNDPRVPVSALDIAGILIGLYLLAVAVFGHWRPYRKGS
jgi:hypothetical protein